MRYPQVGHFGKHWWENCIPRTAALHIALVPDGTKQYED